MTTKQEAGEPVVDVSPTATAPVSDDAQPTEDAVRQVLAKARYEAFQLITGARTEAEAILSEARVEAAGTVKAAQVAAESSQEKAALDAAATLTAAQEEAATIIARAHRSAGDDATAGNDTALRTEHSELTERVSELRTLANKLEDRFAAIARTASATDEPDAQSDGEPTDISISEPSQEEPSKSTTIDYSPSEAPSSKDEETPSAVTSEPERPSFYNRRSANLPRLGEESGQSILDMTRALRKSLESD